jgi:sugar phosphate isomerase/epimerase
VKVGLTSYAFRWTIEGRGMPGGVPMVPIQLLEKAAELGAQAVQICDNMPLDDLSVAELDRIRARAQALGLILEVGIRGSRPEQLQRNLEVAQALGARVLRVVLSAHGWEPGEDQVLGLLRDLLPDLHAVSVTLAIENRFRFTPRALADIVRRVDDPAVGVCLDPLNSIANLIGPAETIAALAPLAVTAHAKDAVVTRPGAGLAISGCPLGEGQVDLVAMVEALRATGRSSNILAEGWMDPLDDPAATLAQEEAWARHGIAYLRDLVRHGPEGLVQRR